MFAKTFTTDRLVLRTLRTDDAPQLYERYASDPATCRYMSWRANESVDETRQFIQEANTSNGELPWGQVWGICLDDAKHPVGTIGAKRDASSVEVGFGIARDCWSKGYMTEAVRALIIRIWAEPAVWRIHAHAHVENIGSRRVLEKCGMRHEGIARRSMALPQFDSPQDAAMYAIVRDDLD